MKNSKWSNWYWATPKITRKLISDNSLWDNEQSELKIVVTPGGGGVF